MRHVAFFFLLAVTAACAAPAPDPDEVPSETGEANGQLRPQARPEAQDAGAGAIEAPAETHAPAAGALGLTVASLGDPGQPGLWLETPLVSVAQPGRVVMAGTGRSAELELRPSGGTPGSGSRMSLAAMQAVGAPLTGLPELQVFAR